MNQLNFAAVIFDMDGVIIDSKEQIDSFWIEKAAQYGIALTQQDMDSKIHGSPARRTIDWLFAGESEAEREQILEECDNFELDIDYPPVPGVLKLLATLEAAGVPTALVTSSMPPKTGNVIRKLGLESRFRTVVTANLVERGKPDPACYRLAAQKLGLNPQDCLVFEDAVNGMTAAVGAGMKGVGINTPAQEPSLLEAGAWLVIPDFEGVVLDGRMLRLTNQVVVELR